MPDLASAILIAVAAESLVTPVRIGRPDAPTTLTVWAQQDYSHLAARPAIADTFTAIFEEWARTRPDVQLRLSVMPALELHKAKLQLAAQAGRLPDVASIDSFWMPLFLAGGYLQPLNDDWPEEDRRDFLPFTISTLSDASGRVFGLWHETDCRVLFYRRDLVPTPPRTWDELIDVASRVARERHIAGYLYNAGRWEATVFDHLAMFWGQGGELVDGEGRPIFGEPPHRERMLRLFEFLRETVRSGASPTSVLASNDYQQLTAAATAGDVAMFLGGNWQLNDLRAGLRAEDFANWEIAPIPQANGATLSTGTGGWVWVVFTRDRERRRAAVEFIRDVERRDHAARISMATGHLPARRSVYRDYPFFSRDRWYQRFGEMLRYGSKFYISLAASLIILRADLLIVNFYRGAAEAGVYAISTQVGTLQLADFINPAGLQTVGGNLLVESAASGTPTTGTPGLTGMGTLVQGSVEASNVNVVQEMVDMIQTQRAYEMNSKAVQTTDQMLQYAAENM